MTEKSPENIIQALAAVMANVGYVQKKKQGGVNYTFASETDFIAAVRPWFLEYGIVVYPAEVKDLQLGTYVTSRGATMNRTVVIMTYRFTHAPSGSFIDVTVTGEGADIGDKSANKSLTGAYKYALRQALLIETGDDPDKGPSEGPDPGPPAPKKKPAPKKTKPGPTNGQGQESGPTDAEKKAYWNSLTPEEKGVYRSLGNLIPAIIEKSQRYGNDIAARGAVKKFFPRLEDTGWPGSNTWDDARLRVTIYRKVTAYASLRNAGMDAERAMAGAEAQAKSKGR